MPIHNGLEYGIDFILSHNMSSNNSVEQTLDTSVKEIERKRCPKVCSKKTDKSHGVPNIGMFRAIWQQKHQVNHFLNRSPLISTIGATVATFTSTIIGISCHPSSISLFWKSSLGSKPKPLQPDQKNFWHLIQQLTSNRHLCNTDTSIMEPCRTRNACRTHVSCVFLRICHVSTCRVHFHIVVSMQHRLSFPKKKLNLAGARSIELHPSYFHLFQIGCHANSWSL